jgi:glycosyltransferase involved in cell wall biosynthesis
MNAALSSLSILYVGESWLGSCARSLKEALARQPSTVLDEVNEDLWMPRPLSRPLRVVNRFLAPAYRRELSAQILRRVVALKPDIVVAYKGTSMDLQLIADIQKLESFTVNVYPDYSPHNQGDRLRETIGAYDLIISTKSFHPALWKSVYGYSNPCEFVPQGYDASLHYCATGTSAQDLDVVMVATWRPEYGRMIEALVALLGDKRLRVGIGGNGWEAHRADYPDHWEFPGGLQGRSYVQWLRRARICIAPVTTDVVVDGKTQPGDEDSTRTYELAAAHCFFVHRRTDYVRRLYDEATEVPMFDTPRELAEKILHFLPLADERYRMAAAAHRRAVPAYSIDCRAEEIVALLRKRLALKAISNRRDSSLGSVQ